MKSYRHLALFVGGTLFGSLGLRILASKDAKALYTQTVAAGLRMKESAVDTVTCIQEEASDILAAAKDINEDRKAAAAAGVIEDAQEEAKVDFKEEK